MNVSRRTMSLIMGLGGFGLPGLKSVARAQARSGALVIFAAASMKTALDEVAAQWTQSRGKHPPRLSYAASGALARQIEQGAPADIFVSADLEWMDYLSARNLVQPDSRVNLLGNRLVLVAPKQSTAEIAIQPGFDLARHLGGGRLAMALVESVPAGRYGRAALAYLGAWEGVKDRLAQAENVRAALVLVARAEAPLGIVYATDAAAEPGVRVVASFSEDSHPPIRYPVAMIRETRNPDAMAFLAFLRGRAAGAIFVKHGFSLLTSPVDGS